MSKTDKPSKVFMHLLSVDCQYPLTDDVCIQAGIIHCGNDDDVAMFNFVNVSSESIKYTSRAAWQSQQGLTVPGTLRIPHTHI